MAATPNQTDPNQADTKRNPTADEQNDALDPAQQRAEIERARRNPDAPQPQRK